MVGILRRREMAKKSDADPNLVFSISNRVVTAGEGIRTNMSMLTATRAMTVLLDMTIDSNPTSGAGSAYRFVMNYDSGIQKWGLWVGKDYASSTNLMLYWMGQSNGWGGTPVSAGRIRLAITHDAGSDTVNAYFKKENGTKMTRTATKTFTADGNNWMRFGSTSAVANGLPPGTIHSAKVYDKILPSAEIDAFFA